VYGAQIIWNGAAVPTTLNSDSELVASVAAPIPGTFPLMVTNPNPAQRVPRSARQGWTGQVVLLMQPSNGTDVRVSNTLNLGLNITGTNNTGVTLR